MRRPSASATWGVLAAAWAALIWALLTTPVPPQVPPSWLPGALLPVQDKLGHAGIFFVQAGLLQRALRRRLGGRRALLAALVACLLLGAATELRQRWVPHREGDLLDLLADLAGATLYGALLATGWGRALGSSSTDGS